MAMTPTAKAYKAVRDSTLLNPNLSTADQIGVLELVKFEILRGAQASVDVELRSSPYEVAVAPLGPDCG